MWSTRNSLAASVFTIMLLCSANWLRTLATSSENTLESAMAADQLSDLDRRITALEKVEPFNVVDSRGQPIFVVGTENDANVANLLNSKGVPVGRMGANADGGYYEASSADDSVWSSLDFTGSRPSVSFNAPTARNVTENGVTRQVTQPGSRLDIGRGEAGNYGLKFFVGSNNMIAGIGESKAGTGIMVLGDLKNETRAGMAIGEDGKGFFGIRNAAGKSVLAFGEATGNTGGELAIGDA